MAEPLHATVGQFSSTGGRWQPARSERPRRSSPRPTTRERNGAACTCSSKSPARAAAMRLCTGSCSTRRRRRTTRSGEAVEVALRQAVREVQAILRRANEALPEAHWRAGLTMVVRYGSHLVIGQAGPALLLVSHPKTVNVYPEKPGESGPALGGVERPEVFVYDAVLEPGSIVLLAQSDWSRQVRLEALAVAAAATSVAAATAVFGPVGRQERPDRAARGLRLRHSLGQAGTGRDQAAAYRRSDRDDARAGRAGAA